MPHHARLFSGRWYQGRGRSGAISSTTPGPNVITALPFDQLMVIDAVGLHNKGGGSNDPLARIGIYTHDPLTGLPDQLVFGSDEINMSTGSTGIKIADLDENWESTDSFWVAAVFAGDPCSDIAACTINALAHQEAFGDDAIDSTFSPRYGVSVAYTFAALPSTFPSGAGGTLSTMALAVRGATV